MSLESATSNLDYSQLLESSNFCQPKPKLGTTFPNRFRGYRKYYNEQLKEDQAANQKLEVNITLEKVSKHHGSLKLSAQVEESNPNSLSLISSKSSTVQNEKAVKTPKTSASIRRKESKSFGKQNYSYGDYRECTNYMRYGYCRFGAKCIYEHPEDLYDDTIIEALEESELQSGLVKEQVSRKKPCWFFNHSGYCYKGNSCNFSHTLKNNIPKILNSSSNSETVEEKNEASRQMCKNFIKYRTCRLGEHCKYSHVRVPKFYVPPPCDNPDNENIETTLNNEDPTSALKQISFQNELDKVNSSLITLKSRDEVRNHVPVKRYTVRPPKPSLYIEDLSEEDIQNLWKDEVTWLKKRFQRRIISEMNNEFEVYFYPSDPEWPFDIKWIALRISFPVGYPREICVIECLNKEETLPIILVRHINRNLKEWLTMDFETARKMKKIKFALRPFLKWLDRNLENLFIEGLKKVKRDLEAQAAGIEFVPCEEILDIVKLAAQNKDVEDTSKSAEIVSIEEVNERKLPSPPDSTLKSKHIPSFTARRGTEIKLRNMELTDQAATLTCRKLAVTVQCGRCRLRSDIVTPPYRINKIQCSRCHHNQQVVFRPQLLHQFLAVLGFLDLDDCSVVDIPFSKCHFSIGCLNCNRQGDIDGLQFGQKQHVWCLYCNSKMGIRVESVKFQYIHAAAILDGAAHLIKLGKKVRKIHDPAIQEGKPLPDNGTCKHYKKSFRWLRFPCCGKAYSCDLCHNEKETDHEMKLANRMICGFCAKEQPYTNGKDCVSCSSNMNKRTGTHWEGGKGCRDKIKMNREDKQKYQGITKTMSKKAQLANQN